MATAEQVLSLWKTLVPREREAVFLAIAREATFSPAVRELAASSLAAAAKRKPSPPVTRRNLPT